MNSIGCNNLDPTQLDPNWKHYTQRAYVTTAFFGCTHKLTLYGDFCTPHSVERADACWLAIENLLISIDKAFSPIRIDSDAAVFETLPPGHSMNVGPLTAQLVAKALELQQTTCGYFNPGMGWLTDLWGFSARTWNPEYLPERPYDRARTPTHLPLPDPRYIEAFSGLAHVETVRLTRNGDGTGTLYKTPVTRTVEGVEYGVAFDLGGLAKGYVADRAAAIAHEHGFAFASFSCSSSLSLLGCADRSATRRNDPSFGIHVVSPYGAQGGPRWCLQLYAKNCTVSTSGDYGRCYVVQGVRYGHVLNPHTGLPAGLLRDDDGRVDREGPRVRSVTLIGPNATDGDALATALAAMEPQRAVEFFNERLAGVWHIVLIADDGYGKNRRYLTDLDASLYRQLDPSLPCRSHPGDNGTISPA